jgi:cell wall-associated NlpC family hydrolase
MTPFFDSSEKIAQLQFHAALWIGTPFMPNAAVRGAGVSCQKLVGAIYQACGVVPKGFAVPEGPMDWSQANERSLIGAFMAALPMFTEITASDGKLLAAVALPGDMAGFKIGGALHHCGIVIAADGQLIHCVRNRGVFFSNLNDATYLSRVRKIWRPIKQ